jgi:hypothetical protein
MDKPKTFGLKLSEVRGCDNCGKKIAPIFQHIQIRKAIFNPANVNGVLGLMRMWGNQPRALGIAEVMAPGADNAVDVLDEPNATTTLFLCMECFLGPVNLALLEEKRSDAQPEGVTTNGREG